jgi:hypothetical protein
MDSEDRVRTNTNHEPRQDKKRQAKLRLSRQDKTRFHTFHAAVALKKGKFVTIRFWCGHHRAKHHHDE